MIWSKKEYSSWMNPVVMSTNGLSWFLGKVISIIEELKYFKKNIDIFAKILIITLDNMIWYNSLL